jgi:flagellar hook-associated protein 1 FlgK
VFIGRGVELESIQRVVDEALETRLRDAVTNEYGSTTRAELFERIEAIQNEFTEVDLSSRLGDFFNSFSNLANNPQDLSLRTLVTSEAATLTDYIRDMRSQLTELRTFVDRSAAQSTAAVDDLLSRIETLNDRIIVAEGGQGGASALRDQRDVLIGELAQYLDISTNELSTGAVDVFVGSLPIIMNGKSRGVELVTETVNGEVQSRVVIADDQSTLDISIGELGATIQFRQQDLADALDTLDTLASQLIYQVNRLHTQSQALAGQTGITGTQRVSDATLALNDTALDLDFTPQHGSFEVHLTQVSTGQRISTTVSVDLDGIGGNDTTLNDLLADLDAIANLSASATADGRVQLSTFSDDFEVSFSNDTSGILAVLGVNTFFTGGDASDIAVNDVIAQDARLIAIGREHLPGDNRTALAITALRDAPNDTLSGLSLTRFWNAHVEDFAIRQGQAREKATADGVVRANLEGQQQAISGVNADEEAINLIRYQRAYQASARFLTVVDEMINTLLALV